MLCFFFFSSDIPGPALLSSVTRDNSASGNMSNLSSSFSQFASFTSPATSQTGTPQPSLQEQPRPPAHHPAPADPFASLQLTSTSTPQQSAPTVSNDDGDDEWSFSSSLPPPPAADKPREHRGTINESQLRIDFLANRGGSGPRSIPITMTFSFSNNSAQALTGLHFQLAVTKVSKHTHKRAPTPDFAARTNLDLLSCCSFFFPHSQGYELQLTPQTGRDLAPKQSRGITQHVQVWHAGNRSRKVDSVKLRWRATYQVANEQKNETGEIPEVSIA